MNTDEQALIADVLADAPASVPQPAQDYAPSTHMHVAADAARQAAAERVARQQYIDQTNAQRAYAAAQHAPAHIDQGYVDDGYRDPYVQEEVARVLGPILQQTMQFNQDQLNDAANQSEARARAAYGDADVDAALAIAKHRGVGHVYLGRHDAYASLMADYAELAQHHMPTSRQFIDGFLKEPLRPRRR
jgi:membrane carboxypeptidase/penicillin-binding protein